MNGKRSKPTHKKILLYGRVMKKDGEFYVGLLSKPLYQYFLKTNCKVGDDISMLLTTKRPTRSESQNNFYHLYLSLVKLSSGHTLKELKAWVRETILSKGITEVYGERVRITDSSADLNISEFAEMMNKVMDKTGIPIPDPAPFKIPLLLDEYGHLKAVQKEKYSGMKPKIKKVDLSVPVWRR